MAVLANVALTNTFDTWRLRTNALLTRVNAFTINESAFYANTLTANVSFTSKGLATFNGRATVGTNLTVSGNTTLGAAGKTITTTGAWSHTGWGSFTTNLTVSGNTTLGAAGKVFTSTGLHNHVGRQTISTNLYVAGNTVLGNANTVTDRTIINGVLVANGNFTVAGNTTIGGASKTITMGGAASTLTIGGAGHTTNTTGWFGVAGRATVSTNLFVGGNTTLNGTTIDKSNSLSQTLTDGATISWDTSLGRVATVTLAGNRAVAAPTNLKVGTYILNVIQDATGSRTLTWNAVFKWTGGVAPVLTTTANARDVFSFFSDGTNLYGSYLPDVK